MHLVILHFNLCDLLVSAINLWCSLIVYLPASDIELVLPSILCKTTYLMF